MGMTAVPRVHGHTAGAKGVDKSDLLIRRWQIVLTASEGEDEDKTYSARRVSNVERPTQGSQSRLDIAQRPRCRGYWTLFSTEFNLARRPTKRHVRTRHDACARRCDIKDSGEAIQPLSRYETTAIVLDYANKKNKGTEIPSIAESIILRKIELQRQRGRANAQSPLRALEPPFLTSLQLLQLSWAPSAVLDHLGTIQSTRYENSFASRLYGSKPRRTPGLIAVD
ncbi:hypothetical protein EDD16DRAFT_1702875 [Pisolithus croceorrhizus]|nr:hypothetical protein EV401DRAFT_2075579 [Pisolithus croceorrhizus]KAI6126152.1 hypothetical protein EDD16DRAFT_1702875 [Pisolithus croceorrhizus]